MSRVSNIPDRGSKEFKDADIAMLEAKHRIVLYGAEDVVDGLRELYDGPAQFALTQDGRRRYSNLLNAMRKDSGQSHVSDKAIECILINKPNHKDGLPRLEA